MSLKDGMRVSSLIGLQEMFEDIFGTKKFFENFFGISGKLILAYQIFILEDSFLEFLFPKLIVNLLLFSWIDAGIRS